MTITSASSLFVAHREERLQAFALASVAGYVDAHSLLRFHVYASFMSGNTTRGGVDLSGGLPWNTALNLLAVLFFVVGAFLGAALLYSRERAARFGTLAVTLGLLVVDMVAGAVHPFPWLSVALLSAAMGCLNSTVTRIGGQPINIGYVSGELYKLAEHLALAYRNLPVEHSEGATDTHLRRAALIASMWGMFLAGALAGGLAEHSLPAVGLWIPVAVLIAVLAIRIGRSWPPVIQSHAATAE